MMESSNVNTIGLDNFNSREIMENVVNKLYGLGTNKQDENIISTNSSQTNKLVDLNAIENIDLYIVKEMINVLNLKISKGNDSSQIEKVVDIDQQKYRSIITEINSLENNGMQDKDLTTLNLSKKSKEIILSNFGKNFDPTKIKLDHLPINKSGISNEINLSDKDVQEKLTLKSNNDFVKICKLLYRFYLCPHDKTKFNKNESRFILNGNYGVLKKISAIENIQDYFDQIGNIKCEDKNFKKFKWMCKTLNIKICVEDENFYIKGNNEKTFEVLRLLEDIKIIENYIDNASSDDSNENINNNISLVSSQHNNVRDSRSSGYTIFFFVVAIVAFLITSAAIINYFGLTFFVILMETKTAGILSIAIPGIVTIGFSIISFCFYYKNKQQKEIKNTNMINQLDDSSSHSTIHTQEKEIQNIISDSAQSSLSDKQNLY